MKQFDLGGQLSGFRDSPVSNNGRGLKPVAALERVDDIRDSPVSNNGRGLKLGIVVELRGETLDSPVSNNGRGLKLPSSGCRRSRAQIRPLAITGVD